MRIGVRAQLFFPGGTQPQVRVAAVEALAAYARLAGPHLTRILPNGSKRLTNIARADFPERQRQQAAEASPGEVFGITVCEDRKIPSGTPPPSCPGIMRQSCCPISPPPRPPRS